MEIAPELIDRIVAHARRDFPNECCGMIAVRIANELDEGNVVFIVCDDGWKYLSSGIYTRPVEEIENLDSTVWW